MKNLLKISCLVFIIMSLGVSRVTAQSDAILLVGTWKMDVETVKAQFTAEIDKQIAAAQTEEEKQQAEMGKSMMPMLLSMMEDMRVSFDADGTMRSLSKNPFAGDEEPEEKLGSWRIDGDTLFTQMEEKEESGATILEISGDYFIMKSNDAEENNLMKEIKFVRAE